MRIVGGVHSGRRLQTPADSGIRPTSDRVREALFNRLVHRPWGPDGAPTLQDARVLDPFCGTGALALEALSRGAARATLMDRDPRHLALARRNVDALGEGGRVAVLRADAVKPPPPREEPHGVVFLDPPYDRGLVPAALAALDGAGWLTPTALCVVELGGAEPLPLPETAVVLDDRRYGDTRIVVLRWHGPA